MKHRNIHFPRSADHEQDWQPYPVDPYYCYMCDHTYIHRDLMLLYLHKLDENKSNQHIQTPGQQHLL